MLFFPFKSQFGLKERRTHQSVFAGVGEDYCICEKKKKLPRALTCQVWDLKNRNPKRGNSNLQNYLWDKYLSHVFEKSGENECNICSHCCR